MDPLKLTREAAFDVRLCTEEHLNNAFIHGYGHSASGNLGPDRPIDMTLGYNRAWFGMRVRDRGGRLVRYRVLASLRRQWGAKGVLDEQGRGLYGL